MSAGECGFSNLALRVFSAGFNEAPACLPGNGGVWNVMPTSLPSLQ